MTAADQMASILGWRDSMRGVEWEAFMAAVFRVAKRLPCWRADVRTAWFRAERTRLWGGYAFWPRERVPDDPDHPADLVVLQIGRAGAISAGPLKDIGFGVAIILHELAHIAAEQRCKHEPEREVHGDRWRSIYVGAARDLLGFGDGALRPEDASIYALDDAIGKLAAKAIASGAFRVRVT